MRLSKLCFCHGYLNILHQNLNFSCCYLPAHELYCCWKHSSDFVCLCKWSLVLTVIFILSLFEMGRNQQDLDLDALMQ